MTLVVGESQHVKNEQSFSSQLLANAACLDLQALNAVGEWSYGQGIRRAHGDKFFYELRSFDYSPFGINHPITLKARLMADSSVLGAMSFPEHLVKRYPHLVDKKWAIQSKTNSTQSSNSFQEDATLKSTDGWDGFVNASSSPLWIVDIGHNLLWVAGSNLDSKEAVSIEKLAAQELMKLFLSPDVLGENGRLAEWKKSLTQDYQWGRWEGLNFYFTPVQGPVKSAAELSHAGIALDVVGKELRACFGLSMLPEDVTEIMRALRSQQG